jgi:predicted NBD/HSP70 family sugar kinase
MVDGPEFVLDAAIAAVHSLLDERGRADDGIAAIGIGLPLPVFHDGGRPHNATNLPDWDGFDVPGYVSRHFNVPVLVDNDANLAALREHLLRPAATEMIAVENPLRLLRQALTSTALLRLGSSAARNSKDGLPKWQSS